MIHHGLPDEGNGSGGKENEGSGRPPDMPEILAKGGGKSQPIAADAEIRQNPCTGQSQKPGEPHVGYGAENAEVREVIGQGPDAGIQPRELPVTGPDGEA